MDKKGRIESETIATLAIVIIGGLVVVGFVVILMGYAKPELGGLGCGLNVRIYSAMLSSTGGTLTSPLLMCNQYGEPVQINAAKWSDCPGIADFCKEEHDKAILSECYRQCARIQIDKLTESCWSMGGSGKLPLWTLWAKIGSAFYYAGKFFDTQVAIYNVEAQTGANAVFLGIPELSGATNLTKAWQDILNNYGELKNKQAAILRCNRFQIVNPGKLPDGFDYYFDGSFGRSWSYYLNTTNPELCKKYATKDDPACSYGGTGVSYLNQSAILKLGVLGIPLADILYDRSYYLNYVAYPRQVCYIAYYEEQIGTKYVIRSCETWNVYAGGSWYLN